MKNLTIKQGMSGINDNSFVNRCKNVITGLTNNTNFPAAAGLIPDVISKVSELQVLIDASTGENRSPKNTLAKNIKRNEVNADMKQVFNAVQAQGIKDITILTSSGFPLEKLPEPVNRIGQPQGFEVMMGPASGECTLKINKLKGAKSYLYQYTETLTPEVANWISLPCTETRLELSGLTPGVRYTFRVCAVRGKDIGAWSDYLIRFMS